MPWLHRKRLIGICFIIANLLILLWTISIRRIIHQNPLPGGFHEENNSIIELLQFKDHWLQLGYALVFIAGLVFVKDVLFKIVATAIIIAAYLIFISIDVFSIY